MWEATGQAGADPRQVPPDTRQLLRLGETPALVSEVAVALRLRLLHRLQLGGLQRLVLCVILRCWNDVASLGHAELKLAPSPLAHGVRPVGAAEGAGPAEGQSA